MLHVAMSQSVGSSDVSTMTDAAAASASLNDDDPQQQQRSSSSAQLPQKSPPKKLRMKNLYLIIATIYAIICNGGHSSANTLTTN